MILLVLVVCETAVYLSGTPIHADDASTGRPLAARAIEMCYAAAN